jgi:hypothetical protein
MTEPNMKKLATRMVAWQKDGDKFSALLLEDTFTEGLKGFRHFWIGENGKVNIQFLSACGDHIDRGGNPAGPVELDLIRIPFDLPPLSNSLLRDVCEYQIGLLKKVAS